MNIFRWTLAVAVVLAGIGFGVFVVMANNFRRSFGASENNLLIGIIPIVLAIGIAWWLVRGASAPLAPDGLGYPVLLVDSDKIAEVCLNAEELTLRPENQDHVIEQRFCLIDSAGRRFRIENYRVVQPKPSTLSRVFNASVYQVKKFNVTFTLRPAGTLSRNEILTQLHDREWTMPAASNSMPLADLYVAYRADRFREFGNARDQMPDESTPEKI